MQLRTLIHCIAAMAIVFSPLFSASPAEAQRISLLRDAEIEKFLDDYSRPIFEVAGLEPDSIKILLVNDQNFNAFAGGRYMGMNTGTLVIADTPNQVEAVIAHETGHLAGGHSARTQDAIAAASRPMLLGVLLAAGAIAAGAPDAGLAIMGLGQTIGTANFLKYSRGQESTADQSSVTYLNKLGKSSKGALEIWRKMRNFQIIRGNQINPYMQSHPLANERLEALRQRVEGSPYFDVVDPPAEIERLKLIQAKIRGFLHEPHETMRHYPLTDQSDPAHYGRALAYYRVSKIDQALSELATLLERHPNNPYFHELKGQMLFEFGRADEAIAPHRRSVELYPTSALLRINLGRTLLASREPANWEQAIPAFKRALLLERDNGFAWSELARAYGTVDNEPLALLATAEARYHWGAKQDANQFARRAIARLPKGSKDWRHAYDVILATQPDGADIALPKPDDGRAPKREGQTGGQRERQEVPDPT